MALRNDVENKNLHPKKHGVTALLTACHYHARPKIRHTELRGMAA
jgi:hypothetical protein